jgi:predicted RecB family endonuclease
MTDNEVFAAVQAELAKARARYPWWPSDMVHAAAIANEEGSEVVKAVNNLFWSHGTDTLEDIQKEAIQAIAMYVRFLTETPDVEPKTLEHNRRMQMCANVSSHNVAPLRVTADDTEVLLGWAGGL